MHGLPPRGTIRQRVGPSVGRCGINPARMTTVCSSGDSPSATSARARLAGLGAATERFVDKGEAGQHSIMREIEGREFCLVPGGS